MNSDRALFHELAKHAIMLGLLTNAERDLISRRHSRKETYWGRHLKDLVDVLADRLATLPDSAFDDNAHLEALADVIEKQQNIM